MYTIGFSVRDAFRCAWLCACLCGIVALHAQDLEQIGKGKAVQLHGAFSLQGGPYFHSGDGEPRNQPFSWNANGSLTLSLYGWQVPFSFTLGSQERSWTQPFNRYGLSPYYKWVKVHLGYRSMQFNPYTLGGSQFFGAGIELDPKGFRFAAFYGRFNKPVAQDTLASITPIPCYTRTGYGMKVGVGSTRNHIDVMLFHAEDDTTSIAAPKNDDRVTPKENLALGLSGRIAITKRISWQFDLGASAMTEDVRSPVRTVDDLPTITKGFFIQRFGSKALYAGNTSLNYSGRIALVRVQVKQVDPDYRSLGAYYQQSDVRAITVEPSVRLYHNKLRIGGSAGRQEDNLYHRKSWTSVRNIASASIGIAPSTSYGAEINYANYGVDQQAGFSALNDTFRVAQVNRSASIAQRYSRTNKLRMFTVGANIGLQQLEDLNPYGTFASAENQVIYVNLYVSRIRIRDNFGVNGGVNYSRNEAGLGEFVLVGPTLGVSRQFAGDKLGTSLSATYNLAYHDGEDAGETLTATCSLQYRYSPMHRFQLTVNVLQNTTTFAAARQYAEVRVLGGYVFVLQPKK